MNDSASAQAGHASQDSARERVLALEERRVAAQRGNDADVLAELLSPQCRFVHSSADADDRDAYLARLTSGSLRYVEVDVSDQEVGVDCDIAIVGFRMRAVAELPTGRREMDNVCTAVWSLAGPGRLVAFHATPAPRTV